MKTLADARGWPKRCDGKVAHPSKLAAQQELLRLTAKTHEHLRAYHCDCCGRWHIGKYRQEAR